MTKLTIDDIASRCDKVRWRGRDTFLACCVAHDDRTPSMSVSERDGKLLFHCFAGCSQSDLLDALGITSKLNYIPRTVTARRKLEKPTASYARQIWKATKPDELISWDKEVSGHPYAIRKEIKHAWGAARSSVSGRLIGKHADCLIIPLRTLDGEFTGVECINAEGIKQTFGKKGVLMLGNTLDKSLPVYVVEGWADGIAAWKYYGNVVVAIVFGIGRQQTLAEALDKARPDRAVIIVRDAA